VIFADADFFGELESTNVMTVSPLPVVRPLTGTGTPADRTGDVTITPVDGAAVTLYGAVPPTTTSWNVLPVHALFVIVAGETVIADEGGVVVV
jgi:hypothetical protein